MSGCSNAALTRVPIENAGGESHHPRLRDSSLADGKARLAFRQGTEQHPRVPYDVVLRGGRVLDPESGLDRRCDVGVDGRRVAAVGDAVEGAETIDVSGLVVAPGFIDLHSHA